MSKRWRRAASVGSLPMISNIPQANVLRVEADGSGSANWIFDSPLDGSPTPWANLDGFLVNGEMTNSATKLDDFTVSMSYPTFVNAGDPWTLNAAATVVIFDPPASLQNGGGLVV